MNLIGNKGLARGVPRGGDYQARFRAETQHIVVREGGRGGARVSGLERRSGVQIGAIS